MKISFIVPCYNEEGNITLFYENVKKAFKQKKYELELIFINDGSIDNTYSELKGLVSKKDFEIKVINFSRNFGKEAGIYAGIKNCTGDYAIIIDADMQQPPSLVLPMLEVVENNVDIDIVAYYQESRIENKLIASIKSKFYKIMSKSSKTNMRVGASDFRLFNRKVIDAILTINEHERFSKGIFSWIGFNTYYLPYVPEERKNGKTSWSLISLFKYGLSGILSFSKLPLSLMLSLGIFNMLLSIFIFAFQLILKVSTIYYLFPFILLIFGINTVLLGIMSEYIYRNYNESRNRPIYIVKEVLNNEKSN